VVAINLSFDSSVIVAPAASVSKENLDYFGADGQAARRWRWASGVVMSSAYGSGRTAPRSAPTIETTP
jgi:hypothetical protein